MRNSVMETSLITKIEKIFLLFVLVLLTASVIFYIQLISSENLLRDPDSYPNLFFLTFQYILGWTFFIVAIVFHFLEQQEKERIYLSINFGLTACILVLSVFLVSPMQLIQWLWMLSILAISVFFSFQYTIKLIPTHLKSISKLLIILLSGLLLLLTFVNNFVGSQTYPITLRNLLHIWTGILLILSLISGFIYFVKSQRAATSSLHLFSTIGFLLGWTPFSFWFITSISEPISPISPWISLSFSIYPLLIGLVFLRQKTNDSKIDMRLFLLVISLIGLIILVGGLINPSDFSNDLKPPLYLGFSLFLMPIILLIIGKNTVIKKWESDIHPGMNIENQKGISQKLVQIERIDLIYEEIRKEIIERFEPDYYHHYFLDPATHQYSAFRFNSGSTSDLRFNIDSKFIEFLNQQQNLFIINEINELPDEIFEEKEKIALLNSQIFMPSMVGTKLVSFIALGFDLNRTKNFEKISSVFQTIMDHYSKEISRYHYQRDLEQRINNLNVLNRIVSGVNYTLALNDIYELIYTQTNQIIPLENFYIILKNLETGILRFVFVVESDERLFDKENKTISNANSLEAQIIESGRGLIINHYMEYCQSKNYPILFSKLEKSIYVPLNTGAITNGCIILGRRENNNSFSTSELELMQSIADLVAGTIEKARLLEETEQYAKQLSILNDLTRKLTSTLDIEELYSTILQNSIDMVPCEEINLLIFDEGSSELAYLASLGRNLNELRSKRVSIEQGYIGRTYQSKKPILINDGISDQFEFGDVLSENNNPLTSILVVPMIFKDQVIGLIELRNRNELPGFSANDLQLISALAAQAAIALENVRLYRRTDQELAKRVEELSVMQQFDRELNISLDAKKATEIALNWALQHSKCDAGWIGLVQDSEIQITGFYGYDPDQFHQLDTQLSSILEEVENNKKRYGYNPFQIDTIHGVHPQSVSQVILPIHREDRIIAILVMDIFNERIMDQSELNFLTRLGEHASIAIMNGKLYTEVQAANQAKSDFVSLVAHELKNPMTSIKGYTELLASGTVGTINQAQANFLSTIRNNTDRMNSLVSDLNDLSKIESGIMRIDFNPVDFEEIMSEIIRTTKKQLEEKQHTLIVKIDEKLPRIWADPSRLLQILINIISNAHKYTPENGEIIVEANLATEALFTELSKPTAHIKIIDHGIGISEEDKKMIFQKFFRSEDPTIRLTTGTGLGLNITRSLVEMQGGRIWFESEYGKGTTFHFTLPLAS